ncbi:MAG: MFS transporter [Methanomassiliicoccus sp.]|nr:MFS transporter [Methanomassiliicoccus sp.]
MRSPSSLRGLDRRIWILAVGRIISATGYSIVMPFLAIHLNSDLGIPMGQVGAIYLFMAVAGASGQIIGGEVADRLGRRSVMWASMVLRGVVFIFLFAVMAISKDIWLISGLLLVSSLLGAMFDPASNAMVADLVVPGQRMEAYNLLRIGQNIGWTLGPLISGTMIVLLPFSYLFAVAAVTCLGVGVVIFLKVADPARSEGPHVRFHPRDLAAIMRHRLFFVFCIATLPLGIVMGQMSSTFSVFAVEDAGITEVQIGYLYALSGIMVVALQFPMARLVSRYKMPNVLALGALLYAAGYAIIGLPGGIWLLVASMIITTLGENVISPSSNALVATLSPENERGRYMGAFGIFSSFGWSVGPAVGGVLYDALHTAPLALWGAVSLIALLSVLGYLYLGRLSTSSHRASRATGAKG